MQEKPIVLKQGRDIQSFSNLVLEQKHIIWFIVYYIINSLLSGTLISSLHMCSSDRKELKSNKDLKMK